MASIVITENSSYLSVKESSAYIIDNPKIGNEYFTQLKDSPSSFNGNEGYVLSVKGDASALEFTDLDLKYLGLNAKASSALTADSVQWVDVENKPISFDPSVHSHAISDVSGLQTDLDSKADDSATSEALGSLGAQLAGKASASHGHGISDVIALQTELDAKAGKVVTSAALSSLGTQLDGKASTSHSHLISDVTNLQAELDTKSDDSATSAALSSLGIQLSGKASALHSHAISDVSGLQTALDSKADDAVTSAALSSLDTQLAGKASALHSHGISDVTGLQTELNNLSESGSGVPAGCVMPFAGSTPPSDWMECDGQVVSRTVYADLFAAIGTSYGSGDGSTTFSLPDLRGEFLRGWDNTRGVDSGRAIGTSQSGEIQSHGHTGTADSGGSHSHTGSTNSAGSHTHTVSGVGGSWTVNGTEEKSGHDVSDRTTKTTSSSGSHTHTVTINSAESHSHNVLIDNSGGTETRPRNIAMMYCIKI